MKYLLFLSHFLSGCTAALPPVHSATPPRFLGISADFTFTSHERELLSVAVQALRVQTAGQLELSLSYSSEPNLLRVQSDYKDVVDLDASFKGFVYGFTSMATGRMFLVDDRLKSDDMFIHTAMHEILHRVGLEHIVSTTSIMNWYTNPNQHVTCMDRHDAVEFCRVLGCDAERLHYCGR